MFTKYFRHLFYLSLASFLFCPQGWATNHITRIESVMAGFNGDTSIQFVQMVANGNSQKRWGPQGSETVGRAMLVFFDNAGNQTGQFVFSQDPPAGSNNVLIATQAFANFSGITPDIIIPPGLIQPNSGKVCFKNNPANTAFSINLCLSYGSFTGNTEGAGDPAPALPITGPASSLNRFQGFSFGTTSNNNADFILGSPVATNTQNQSFSFPDQALELSVTSIDFNDQPIAFGPTSPQKIIISNNGQQASLNISNVILSQGPEPNQFIQLLDTGQTSLSPGQSRSISYVFDPSSTGPKTAIVSVITDSGNGEVTLSGQGIAADECFANIPAEAIAMDDCAVAQIVCPDLVFTGTTIDATSDGSSSCDIPGENPDVWYRYAPATDGLLTISLAGSSFDTVLSVHSQCLGTIQNEIACNDDNTDATSEIRDLPVTAGEDIFIRITGFAGETGTFQMLLTGPPCFDFDRNSDGIIDGCQIDFGDAPASYPTLLADNGARHRIGTGLFLGTLIDTEGDGKPSANASGDNFDGPPNDDDGVVFRSPLIANTLTNLDVTSSQAGGFLSAWIDFNRDGDWNDDNERIITDEPLAAGLNNLNFISPASVSPGLTYARFRISTGVITSPTGEAFDGEVEDYAVEILDPAAVPGNIGVRINEIMAGLNGDSSIQFIELEVTDDTQKGWGPQGGETTGRAMLVFTDISGTVTGRFVFPSDAPAGGSQILIATEAFATHTGITPDFIMPPELLAISGQVAFQDNPANSHFSINIALSYGGNEFVGTTANAGFPHPDQLPILGASSLTRVTSFPFGTNQNAAFTLASPTPLGTQGQTFTFTEDTLIKQGELLFTKEAFRGNGRSCAACHVPGSDQFGLTPNTIASLPADDLLFIAEFNLNTLVLTASSQPSDLRGSITGTTGSATILSGSGNTYLVYGGDQLSGTITDTNGNTATFQSFTPGDLGTGPTNSNGSLNGLENPARMRGGRALILENIDGFEKKEVFRASPHLLNLAETAPYGLSGEFPDLRGFSKGAVAQHFPRSLNRISGIDFREPTEAELVAMEAFQNSISNPSDNDFDLSKFATTQAQKRGQALFFSPASKCSQCHAGPALSDSDGTLPGSLPGINENFDTGVANRHENMPAHGNLPTEPAGLVPGQSTRKFNTPPLFGIKLTAPFFHDASSPDLRSAVEFYDTSHFTNSPAGQLTGSIDIFGNAQDVDDLIAFLESLVEIPTTFTRNLSFGQFCVTDPPSSSQQMVITNDGSDPISIQQVSLEGSDASHFAIQSDSGETSLNPGQSRTLNIIFDPNTSGLKTATVEIQANQAGPLGDFSFACEVTGSGLTDATLTPSPSVLAFTFIDVDAGPSTPLAVNLTNNSSDEITITSVNITGPDASLFTISADSGETTIPPGSNRSISIQFDPDFSGTKQANLVLTLLSCSGLPMEIPLSGNATISASQYIFEGVPEAFAENTTYPITIQARASNGELVTTFNETNVTLSTLGESPFLKDILITEIDASPDAVEFTNVSNNPVDVSGWQITIYQSGGFPAPAGTITIPSGSIVESQATFTLNEFGSSPGIFPSLFFGDNINWTSSSSDIGVLLRDDSGNIVDFATSETSTLITNPVTIPSTEWSGAGFSGITSTSQSHQRTGNSDTNQASDWSIGTQNLGSLNPGLLINDPSPLGTIDFINGIAQVGISFTSPATGLSLFINDAPNRVGQSNLFDVVDSLSAFLVENFTPAERSDPLVTGFDTDTDNDGLTLLGEFGLGKDPNATDNFDVPKMEIMDISGQDHIVLTFTERINDPLLSVELLESTNLIDWTPVPDAPVSSVETQIPGVHLTTFEIAMPPGPRRFYRIEIQRN